MNLCLLQIADSALPISGYTHSWGLEAAIARKLVHDAETLERFTRLWLRTSLGPFEGVLAASACRAARAGEVFDLHALNAMADAGIMPPSIRHASREMGEQLLNLGTTWEWSSAGLAPVLKASRGSGGASPHWHHSVAFGLLGAIAGGSPEEVLTAFLHQAVMGLVAAGVKGVPVGHTHGQQIIAYLHGDVKTLVADLVCRAPETAGGGCPFYEILCDEQTRLYARMFRS